ncbi:MAG: outer membrane protein [Gammaproteobacteria bacterium]
MKFKTKGLTYLLICSLAFSGSLFAATAVKKPVHKHKHHKHRYKGDGYYKGGSVYARNHFDLIGAGSISNLRAGNGSLGITSSETDRLIQTNTNSWDAGGGQLGLGYVFNLHNALQCSDCVQWFTSIEPELNLYYFASNSIRGHVWRFNSSSFNDLTFDIPVHSTRLMVDGALTVASWRQLSVYAIGGIGNAWNRLGYRDTVNGNVSSSTCPEQRVTLNPHTTTDFAWEAGAGLTYTFNDRVSASLEYLYAHLGTVKTGARGNTGTITAPITSPASFNLKTQNVLLGLHIAL